MDGIDRLSLKKQARIQISKKVVVIGVVVDIFWGGAMGKLTTLPETSNVSNCNLIVIDGSKCHKSKRHKSI